MSSFKSLWLILFALFSFNSQALDRYSERIKPIFEKRCVACHACFNSPCQLKLNSYEGIERGSNKTIVFSQSRLKATPSTRLFTDAKSKLEWRKKGFYSVTEHSNVLLEMVERREELDNNQIKDINFKEKVTAQKCSNGMDELKKNQIENPGLAMPYGLPKLKKSEVEEIRAWANENYPGPKNDNVVLSEHNQNFIKKWESLLNNEHPKNQLTARYLYEHLFSAHIHFDEKGSFFKLVRADKRKGEVNELATIRPTDYPGKKFYYRFRKMNQIIAYKTHVTFNMDQAKFDWIKENFISFDWGLADDQIKYPSWETRVAYNPFLAFEQIPVISRYKFMLNDAFYFFDVFIRGTVCHGELAANFIQEHFFNFFIDPKHDPMVQSSDFYHKVKNDLILPGETKSSFKLQNAFFYRYQKGNERYRKKRAKYFAKNYSEGTSLDHIWDGNGNKRDAAFTIFRQFDGSSVNLGVIGATPRTINVYDYSLMERIHYTFVAHYNIFGNVKHHLYTRSYADLLRREAENLFLSFLPKKDRKLLHERWYRGQFAKIDNFLYHDVKNLHIPTQIDYGKTIDTKDAFVKKVMKKLGKKVVGKFDFINRGRKQKGEISKIETSKDFERELNKVVNGHKLFASYLPDFSLIRLVDKDHDSKVYSMLSHKYRSNMNFIMIDKMYIEPERHDVTVAEGILAAYPNKFIVLHVSQAEKFLNQLDKVKDEASYKKFVDEWMVHRLSSIFWQTYDFFNDWLKKDKGFKAGVLDLLRYQ